MKGVIWGEGRKEKRRRGEGVKVWVMLFFIAVCTELLGAGCYLCDQTDAVDIGGVCWLSLPCISLTFSYKIKWEGCLFVEF